EGGCRRSHRQEGTGTGRSKEGKPGERGTYSASPGALRGGTADLLGYRRFDERRQVAVHPFANQRLEVVHDLALMAVHPLVEGRSEGILYGPREHRFQRSIRDR